MANPVSLKDQQAELAAGPELDGVGKAYQSEIETMHRLIRECVEANDLGKVRLRNLKRITAKLNRRFQRHVEDMKP
jgi:hypothetical protein